VSRRNIGDAVTEFVGFIHDPSGVASGIAVVDQATVACRGAGLGHKPDGSEMGEQKPAEASKAELRKQILPDGDTA
jgi:hypothetical protein